tara:strand:- start:37 stop:543 length:507 start_codon:yes stop_codon:yes gene_type:complete
MATDYIQLVSNMSEEVFAEVIQASPRKIRETLFGRMGIKAKKRVGVKVHGKLEDRTKKLHVKLKQGSSAQESELCQELARNWLFTQRDLLKKTLDYLEVPNDNGLIDEDPVFFQEMDLEKTVALLNHLKADFSLEVIAIYLRFVEVPKLDEALSQVKGEAAPAASDAS